MEGGDGSTEVALHELAVMVSLDMGAPAGARGGGKAEETKAAAWRRRG